MLSLHQLTCFVSVYEHGSLTRAAEELGYAQPSVSEQIRALEKSLGVQLFRRVGRGVVPTTVAIVATSRTTSGATSEVLARRSAVTCMTESLLGRTRTGR
jgi:DNA-binding transcriptional LysR family regulator